MDMGFARGKEKNMSIGGSSAESSGKWGGAAGFARRSLYMYSGKEEKQWLVMMNCPEWWHCQRMSVRMVGCV
jgi:hypothetical protein